MTSEEAAFPTLLGPWRSQRIPRMCACWLSSSIQVCIYAALYFVGAPCMTRVLDRRTGGGAGLGVGGAPGFLFYFYFLNTHYVHSALCAGTWYAPGNRWRIQVTRSVNRLALTQWTKEKLGRAEKNMTWASGIAL